MLKSKLFSYFYMVINLYFFVGIIIGVASKYYFGGKVVSLVTGIVIGMLIADFIRIKFLS